MHQLWTCANSEYFGYLIGFIASARENACWKGPIFVIDYGLTSEQKKALENQHIQCIPALNRRPVYLDRFTTLAAYADPDATLALYDTDIYFLAPIQDIFDQSEHLEKLLLCLDPWLCTFVEESVVNKPGNLEKVSQWLLELNRRHRKHPHIMVSLQAGFLCGQTHHFTAFSETQEALIRSELLLNRFGTDTATLLHRYHHQPETMHLLSTAYNCLPQEEGLAYSTKGTLLLNKEPVKAFHFTRKFRDNPDYHTWSYGYNFPEQLKKWTALLQPTL